MVKHVLNLSLLHADSAILSKGLNYSLGANKLNIFVFLSAFELTINRSSYEKKHLIRSVIVNSYIKFTPKKMDFFPSR